MESMQGKLGETSGLKKKIVNWGAKKGIQGNLRRQSRFLINTIISLTCPGIDDNTICSSSGSKPLGWSVADKLVFKKVREALGFQRCKIFVVGSAPTRPEVHDFYLSYDMPLMELYGEIVKYTPHCHTHTLFNIISYSCAYIW